MNTGAAITPSSEHLDVERAAALLRHETGVVIPVYLPQGIDRDCGQALLRENVAAYCRQVADPAMVCLSVDGEPFGAQFAAQLAGKFGTRVHVAPANKGKLHGAANGVRTLLAETDLAYVAIVDQDGDHFANELLNFVRAAQHIVRHTGRDRVLVLGGRLSRHRPLGLLRGELEELADRVLLDALFYRSVVTGRPLRLEYAFAHGDYPDFHSGYKLFSRATAGHVFLGPPHQAGVSDDCYYRHACEAVMVVEALEQDAYLGVVNRTTVNEQPVSTFGLYNASQLMADTIIWPCKRLEIPLPFVRQWLDNHIPRLLLSTLIPDGRRELERIRELVCAAYGQEEKPGPSLQPLFV
jgi:hypothetical protein